MPGIKVKQVPLFFKDGVGPADGAGGRPGPEPMHNLLRLQIKRHLGEAFAVSPEWERFFDAVSNAYQGSDEERSMLMRSLDLSSGELLEANAGLRAVVRALEQEKERFHYVALATRDAIYDWDIRTGSMWGNEGCQALYSAAVPAVLDRRGWEERIHPDDRGRILDGIRQAFAERRPLWSAEYRFRRGGGAGATLNDSGDNINDQAGRPVREIGAMTDITERKLLEEQVRQSQKMEAVGQLAGGVAHDFNNLLTVILGNVSLLQQGGLTDADRELAIEDTYHAADRAANLTRQLLTFSRRQPFNPRSIDLGDVVADTTRMLRRLIGEHIAIETRAAPSALCINADPGMIEQALVNLAVNSRAALPRGGRLVLETAQVVFAGAEIRPPARAGTFVRLSVTDSGSGISPEHLSHIFEPFFTTKEVGKGTGLGLATVFGVVEQHQGWIEVEGNPGTGAAFHLFFPLVAPVAAPARPPPVESVRGAETILVAEDEPMVRSLIQAILERHGYQVHAVPSGTAALSVWQEHRDDIDLLITDTVMPGGISGIELAQRLRAERAGLKVIHISGYNDEMLAGDSRLRRRRAHFLAKPFLLDVFLEQVRQCLDGKPGESHAANRWSLGP